MKKGIWYAIGAYSAWGLFPIYWKLLQIVPAPQLISHRVAWSFLSLLAIILFSGTYRKFRSVAFKKKVMLIYCGAALLIGTNWLIYVWAVNSGFIIETSLGYFINPLFSVLLGVVFLHEKMRVFQWVPVGLAGCGVIFLTFVYGSPPWIALSLAASFGTYGLIKKIAPLSSLYGLTLETGMLLIPAVFFLLYTDSVGQCIFLHAGVHYDLLLIGAGPITIVPLLMFASATRRIPLSLVGILHYIAPSLQFLLGVAVYKEPFTTEQLIGYSIVWIALILFAVEGLHARRSRPVIAVIE
jgi:chloramphenicol-sensitive protein RarD